MFVNTHTAANNARTYVLVLVHAACALAPCAAFLVFAAAALEYTTPSHLAYLVAVWLALAFSCCRRVWTALSHRAQHLAGHAGAPDAAAEAAETAVVHHAAPHATHHAVTGVPVDGLRGVILKGTSQLSSRFGEHKKQQ